MAKKRNLIPEKWGKPQLFSASYLALLGSAVLLLLTFALASGDAVKIGAIALLIVGGVLLVVKAVTGGLSALGNWNTGAVLLYMVVFGVTSFLAVAPRFAMTEYSRLLVGFGGYLVVMLLAGKAEKREGLLNQVCFAMAVVSALVGAASICATFNVVFAGLLSPITSQFLTAGGVESGIRMVSILGNPNSYAGFTGLAIVATLILVLRSHTKRERGVSLFLFSFNCIAFLLAFSMGASAAMGAGFMLMLLVMPGEKRGELFAVLVLTMMTTVVGVALAFPQLETAGGVLSLVMALVCAVVTAVAGQLVLMPVLDWCAGRKKLVLGGVSALVVLFAVGTYLALTLTGSYQLQPNTVLRRSAYPQPGSYTLTVDSDAPVMVSIISQDERETIIHSETVLYSGPADGATFQVPEGSLVTYFSFTGDSPTTLQSAQWSGNQGTGELALKYRLLPEFIANRLQGLKANENAIQRTAFFQDGLKLFALAPLTGRGLGGFENGVLSVQSFYYETKYVHNHFIQTLCDGGILGGLSFLALLGACGYGLIRSRRKGENGVTASVLLGGLLFVIIHAMAEIVFSNGHYLVFVFLFFALSALVALPGEGKSQGTGKSAFVAAAVSLALCLVFGGFWVSSQSVSDHSAKPGETVYDALDRFRKKDYFGRNDVMMTYVSQTLNDGEVPPEIQAQADLYAEKLSQVESNSIGQTLITYYLYHGQIEKAFEVANFTAHYVRSSSEQWNGIFYQLASLTTPDRYLDNTEAFQSGLSQLLTYFQEVQSQQLDVLTLDEVAQEYIQDMADLAAMETVDIGKVCDILLK